MSAEPRHDSVVYGVHYVVDVPRASPGVRPQADVDLIRIGKLGHHAGRPMQESSHRGRLFSGEIRHVDDVAFGLDDEGSDAERADAVLYHPARFSSDDSTRQHSAAAGEIAGSASFHGPELPARGPDGGRVHARLGRPVRASCLDVRYVSGLRAVGVRWLRACGEPLENERDAPSQQPEDPAPISRGISFDPSKTGAA